VLLGFGTATLAAIAALSACLTDPPPDLPLQSEPPTIVHESLKPAEGLITSSPIPEFVVPIRIPDPTASCQFSFFDEYDQYFQCQPCDTTSFDAGVVSIAFTLGVRFDPTVCHTLKFTVASSFSPADPQCRSGSDVAIWTYQPESCLTYDAGALADGAFPEASTDALPIVPDSGDEP
jgi:hypothetical protein